MATVTLNAQQVSQTGIVPAYTAAGASPLLNVTDTFRYQNTGREILHFKKSGAGACNVIFTTPQTVDGLAVADRTIVVPASTGDVMVLLNPAYYNNPGESLIAGFTLSEITGLSVAIIRI